jgi:hypothetical protein
LVDEIPWFDILLHIPVSWKGPTNKNECQNKKNIIFIKSYFYTDSRKVNGRAHFKSVNNGRISTVNRALDGSTYPG